MTLPKGAPFMIFKILIQGYDEAMSGISGDVSSEDLIRWAS
jgi:hypothetical protein